MRKATKKKLSLHKETLNAMDLADAVGGVPAPPPGSTAATVCTINNCATVTATCTFH
jgi:hypothetical protein